MYRGMVFIPESKVFFVCSAIVFKAFQRGTAKYFLQKKILFHGVLSVGVMTVGVISVGVMTVGVLSVGVMALSHLKRNYPPKS
jgi:hypothetical protein